MDKAFRLQHDKKINKIPNYMYSYTYVFYNSYKVLENFENGLWKLLEI